MISHLPWNNIAGFTLCYVIVNVVLSFPALITSYFQLHMGTHPEYPDHICEITQGQIVTGHCNLPWGKFYALAAIGTIPIVLWDVVKRHWPRERQPAIEEALFYLEG